MKAKGIELFAGGGGLLLGSSLAGVDHVAASEWNQWACMTMRQNASASHPLVKGLNVLEGDVRNINWRELYSHQDIDIVTGGPPCQPFSTAGLARSAEDPRDMFPAATSAIDQLHPRAFIIENVRGLTRAAFADYFEFIKLRLKYPSIRAREGETWADHWRRLQREDRSPLLKAQYNLSVTVVNAADYGVPQHRHRVFIIGFRNDIDSGWSFPPPTHSGAALAKAQSSGEYWDLMEVAKKDRLPIRRKEREDGKLPWQTVRQALQGLPEPEINGPSNWLDHEFRPGAKSYPGHTGSPIDEPSKALKAGVHGVPGGENMIRFPDGTVRYYSVREAARIQTFPDDYALHGAWSEAMRQIGNAVPVRLAEIVTKSVLNHLNANDGTVTSSGHSADKFSGRDTFELCPVTN